MRSHKLLLLLGLFLLSTAAHAAPIYTYQPTLLPQSDNAFDLGTSSKAWRDLYVNRVCLQGDTCRTTWPSGGGSSAYPFTPQSWGVSTTTAFGFPGLIVTGSTTFSGLGTGLVKVTNGLLGTASNGTDYTLITALSCGAGNHVSAITAAGVITCSADTGSGGGTGNVATSSQETNTYIPFWTSTAATPATLSGGVSTFTFNSSVDRLTLTYATTTALSASSQVAVSGNGSVTLPAVSVGSSKGGLYQSATGTIGLTNGTNSLSWSSTTFYPNTTDVRNLGQTANRWLGLLVRDATTTNATTTSQYIVGQLSKLLYTDSAGQVLGTATSSLALGTGLNLSAGSLGYQIGGTDATIKLADTAVTPASYTNANITVDQQGRITAASNGSASSAYDAWTHASIGSSATTSAIGIGTTSPWAQLSVSTSTQSSQATPLFAVASTTNATLFLVTGSGNVGIGTTTPAHNLTVVNASNPQVSLGDGVTGNSLFTFRTVGNTFYFSTTSPTSWATSTQISDIFTVASTSGFTLNRNLIVRGTANLTGALTYGGVTLTNSVTGTGSMVLSANPNLTGLLTVPAVAGGGSISSTLILRGSNAAVTSPLTTGSGVIIMQPWSTLEVARFYPASTSPTVPGGLAIGTTTAFAQLEVATSSASGGTYRGQFVLTDNSAGSNLKHWIFNSQGGDFTIGTTSDLYATSTIPALYIDRNGQVGIGSSTPGSALAIGNVLNVPYTGTSTLTTNFNVSGIAAFTNTASSSFSQGINLKTGCYAIAGVCLSIPTLPIPIASGGTGSTTAPVSQLIYGGGNGTYQSVSTTSETIGAGLTYSGTMGAVVGGVAGTLQQIEHRSFTYSTSTAWTGTTTIPLETGYAEVWNNVVCFTDTGTVGVDFYHSTNHLNYIPTASTTNNTNVFSTNNTITAADKTYVDIGTPVSSPTKINCTLKDTF